MKVIVAGSRTIRSKPLVYGAIFASGFKVTQVVSGGQKSYDSVTKQYFGVDFFGEQYAQDNGIDLKVFAADWSKKGRSAGPLRNKKMAEYADALVAVWDGKSRGTKSMIEFAKSMRLKIFIRLVKGPGVGQFVDAALEPVVYRHTGEILSVPDLALLQKLVGNIESPDNKDKIRV